MLVYLLHVLLYLLHVLHVTPAKTCMSNTPCFNLWLFIKFVSTLEPLCFLSITCCTSLLISDSLLYHRNLMETIWLLCLSHRSPSGCSWLFKALYIVLWCSYIYVAHVSISHSSSYPITEIFHKSHMTPCLSHRWECSWLVQTVQSILHFPLFFIYVAHVSISDSSCYPITGIFHRNYMAPLP